MHDTLAVFLQEHSTFNYVVPLTILSLNLDIHQVVKTHKTIHYLSPQGERKQSSLLSLLVVILLSGNILFKIICQRIIWSHIILNAEWYVSPFTCWWTRAMFVLTFSPLGEKVNTIMVLVHQPVKKSTLGKIVKNCCFLFLHFQTLTGRGSAENAFSLTILNNKFQNTFPDPHCQPCQIFVVQNGVYMCPAYSTTCFKFNQHLREVF